MPRYEVTVVMVMVHQLAVEADNPMAAQGLALADIADDRVAERLEMNVEVEEKIDDEMHGGQGSYAMVL